MTLDHLLRGSSDDILFSGRHKLLKTPHLGVESEARQDSITCL